jgi:cytochrome c biogenesis protein CcmG, thiol:disulfide interchange protein DsbE
MNLRRSLIGIGISLPIIALLAFGLTRDPNRIVSPLPGRDAPDFALPLLDNTADTVRLSKLRGDVVVINFWASWCLACRDEHGDLSATAAAYASRGVRFYGVLFNDSPDNGRDWIRAMGGQTYPALVDVGLRTAIDYGLSGVPETFVIGRDGKVVYKKIGPVMLAELAPVLESLLADRSATQIGGD